jgi:hypothetical protein
MLATNGRMLEPREIREPYPGLRPFLDHEHALLKGRDDQIGQVLERLATTHFVAIIGGSGCGKSSLIRAGVVPLLRSQAIPQAGDYWIPVVFTPGTTKPAKPTASVPDQVVDAGIETPVTRMAWKFAQAMLPPTVKVVDLRLRDEVVSFFRQGAGFSRLVNAYHHLLPRPGPRTDRARFLFVIDQFEELFHPNNRDNADARTVVEAVIEHFLKPDERAFVVMTMRSEHLADCAAYLRLPDAINRSFYLVRRLNNAELREVIVEPAQVMQRRVQRSDHSRSEAVEFEPAAVARLLADVRRIEDDPDHLPLLQHLLARVWSSALAREGRAARDTVPKQVRMADLEAAVRPGVVVPPGWLVPDRDINTLRTSLENWAEHLYKNRRSLAQQALLNELLRRLAFKDPNSGLYFQERVRVDDPTLFDGVANPSVLLHELLDRGFLDTVNYLFWDDENPEHITLKVSHEAFIRGWTRFRKIVDHEGERFDEFVAVMRRCVLWQSNHLADDLLLEGAELERIKGAGLNPVFDDDAQLKLWFAVLRLYREGDRLATAERSVRDFIAASRHRLARLKSEADEYDRQIQATRESERAAKEAARILQAQREADAVAALARKEKDEAEVARAQAETERTKEINRRQNAVIAGIAAVALLLLLVGAYGWSIRDPAMRDIVQYNVARSIASTRTRSDGSPIEGAASVELATLRDAATKVLAGRDGGVLAWGTLRTRSVRDDLGKLPWIGDWLVREQVQQLEMSSSEIVVNSDLRTLLTSALWHPTNPSPAIPLKSPLTSQSCTLPISPEPAPGRTVFAGSARNGLFVPDAAGEAQNVIIYNASRDDQGCTAKSVAFSIARALEPAVLFDARATVMAVVNRSKAAGQASLVLYNIDWGWNSKANDMVAQIRPRRTINNPEAAAVFQKLASAPDAEVVTTREIRGGIEVEVDGRWSLLMSEAQPIDASTLATEWRALAPPAERSACHRLGLDLQRKASLAYDDPSYGGQKRTDAIPLEDPDGQWCFVIFTYDPSIQPATQSNGQAGYPAGPRLPAEEVTVSVYYGESVRAAWGAGGDKPSFPLVSAASFKFTNQVGGSSRDWWLGKPETWADGWLASALKGQSSGAVAAPFSTKALKGIADGLLQSNPAPKVAAATASSAGSAANR